MLGGIWGGYLNAQSRYAPHVNTAVQEMPSGVDFRLLYVQDPKLDLYYTPYGELHYPLKGEGDTLVWEYHVAKGDVKEMRGWVLMMGEGRAAKGNKKVIGLGYGQYRNGQVVGAYYQSLKVGKQMLYAGMGDHSVCFYDPAARDSSKRYVCFMEPGRSKKKVYAPQLPGLDSAQTFGKQPCGVEEVMNMQSKAAKRMLKEAAILEQDKRVHPILGELKAQVMGDWEEMGWENRHANLMHWGREPELELSPGRAGNVSQVRVYFEEGFREGDSLVVEVWPVPEQGWGVVKMAMRQCYHERGVVGYCLNYEDHASVHAVQIKVPVAYGQPALYATGNLEKGRYLEAYPDEPLTDLTRVWRENAHFHEVYPPEMDDAERMAYEKGKDCVERDVPCALEDLAALVRHDYAKEGWTEWVDAEGQLPMRFIREGLKGEVAVVRLGSGSEVFLQDVEGGEFGQVKWDGVYGGYHGERILVHRSEIKGGYLGYQYKVSEQPVLLLIFTR